jgi:hypothetical protein
MSGAESGLHGSKRTPGIACVSTAFIARPVASYTFNVAGAALEDAPARAIGIPGNTLVIIPIGALATSLLDFNTPSCYVFLGEFAIELFEVALDGFADLSRGIGWSVDRAQHSR